jgi:hypothetical protein
MRARNLGRWFGRVLTAAACALVVGAAGSAAAAAERSDGSTNSDSQAELITPDDATWN